MSMDKTIRRVVDPEEQQRETYRYWQNQSVGDRLSAVWDASAAAYAFAAASKERRLMMPRNLKELLYAFNAHAVKYLVIGGYAFGVHAEPRGTKN